MSTKLGADHDLFPKEYHYRARFTKDVLLGMQDLASKCEEYTGSLVGKKVLDIGCNDGSLLNFFKSSGAVCFGVEPTGAAHDANINIENIYNAFFDMDLALKIYKQFGSMDIITFTNVFAHIEDLSGLVDALKIIINENTHLIIENHYLGKVLENNQFDTFYHEHPRTYSATSFKYIAEKLGMKLVDIDFPGRYGGNIRVTLSKKTEVNNIEKIDAIFLKEQGYMQAFDSMTDFISSWVVAKKEEILDLKQKYSHVYAKAFPGRAAILIKLLDIDVDVLSGVFEQDTSLKVGNFVPGTKIPIMQDSTMQSINPPVLLNLAWHIKTEIEQYLVTNGYTGEIRHII